jgi:hypothetical protein
MANRLATYIAVALLVGVVTIATTVSVAHQLLQASGQSSGASIIWGPSPIMEGEAKGSGDLTIMNEYYAVAFGITTTPPWGIPPGHIVDIAPVGEKAYDVAAQFSFPLNDWGNWARIDLEKGFRVIDETPRRAIVIAVGTWRDLLVNYTYIFESGKPYFTVIINVTNTGTTTYANYIMGPAITFEVGWTFVPGYGTGRIVTGPRPATILDDWVAGYHEFYAIGLYAPNYTHISLSTYWVDPFYNVTLRPGESRVFVSYIMVFSKPDVCKVAELTEQLRGGGAGTVRGYVFNTKGQPLETGIVVFERAGRPYCWGVVEKGRYETRAPAPANYTVYAVGRAHAPSTRRNITLTPGSVLDINFTDVVPPGKVIFEVYRNDTNARTDAVITISSPYVPPAQYLAVTTAYTDPVRIGYVEVDLAPGNYTVNVGWAPGFLSRWVMLNFTLATDEVKRFNVTIGVLFKPWERGWYMVDLHHHADYLDGKTPPPYVATAQSAFGLDYVVVSDHDYVGNCEKVKYYAELRNKTFICSVEISPDWAHFNIYPVLYPDRLVFRGTMAEIIRAARAAGALVVRANHPYIGGLFIAQEQNNIPGGYYDDWDLAEINGPWGTDDNRTLMKMMTLWSLGVRKYLTAGSDVHDVWATPRSGFPRVVAYLPEGSTIEALARAELQGRTFITYGPFVFTDPLPGSTIGVKSLSESITVRVELVAVEGLSRLEVWSLGRVIYTTTLTGMSQNLTLSLPTDRIVDPYRGFGWLIVVVYDARGNRAITNPIWVDTRTSPVTVTLPPTTHTVTETRTVVYTETQTIKETTTQVKTVIETKIATERVTETIIYTITYTTTHRETATTTTTFTTPDYTLTAGAAVVAIVVGLAIGLILRRK